MKSRRKVELMVGIFLMVGIALIVIVSVNLGNFTESNKPTYPIKVQFSNAAGLLKGSEVRLGGARIGKVVSSPMLTPRGDAVEFVIAVDSGIKLQQGSQARPAFLNVMGDKYIEIVLPPTPTGKYIDDTGKGVIYGDSGDDLETIKGNVATISQQTIVILDRVEGAMDDMQKAARGFADLTEKLNRGVLSDSNLKNLEVIMGNAASASENLSKASESIPETLENVRDVTKNIKETSEGIHHLVVKVENKMDDLEPAFDTVLPVMKNLNQTTERLNRITTGVEKGNGLFGALLYDRKLKSDVVDFIKHVRAQGLLRYKNPEAENEVLDLRDRRKMEGNRN